jgi:non-specific protein-tyrosine kinase
LVLGLAFVILRDLLDNTVKGPEDFAALGIPVLGYVPFDKHTPTHPVAFGADAHGLRAEAYRHLRTNLQFVNVDHIPRVIAVTSALPGEGKTITAINLAASLAEAGYRVCLVEADLRRPNLAEVLGLLPAVGFTTALVGRAPVASLLQQAGRNLTVLTSGPVPPNPSELLLTVQAREIIDLLAASVDYTIIDTAPLLPVADGAEIATLADATIVVHRAGKTTRAQVQRSIEALAKVGEKPVGAVLNMVTKGHGRGDLDYGYYYASYRPEPAAEPEPAHRASATNGRVGAAVRERGGTITPRRLEEERCRPPRSRGNTAGAACPSCPFTGRGQMKGVLRAGAGLPDPQDT